MPTEKIYIYTNIKLNHILNIPLPPQTNRLTDNESTLKSHMSLKADLNLFVNFFTYLFIYNTLY